MYAPSEKRTTQIDFTRVALNRSLESGGQGKATNGRARKRYNTNNLNPERGSLKTQKSNLFLREGIVDPLGLKSLRLPEIVQSGIEKSQDMNGSPWQKYAKFYDIRLGADDIFATVAERRDKSESSLTREEAFKNLVLVKSFIGPNVEESLRKFEQIHDTSIVSPLEVFRLGGTCYVVFEYMAFSLYYVAGHPMIDEIRLAAIIGQILNGLEYLASKGLEHSSLTCSNILIHPHGDVKIASQECCELPPHSSKISRHFRALSVIVMELMQGYAKEDGAIGIDDLRRWPSDSNAVSFLSATVTATSVAILMEHPLLRLPWNKMNLAVLESFVSIDTHIRRRYPPK